MHFVLMELGQLDHKSDVIAPLTKCGRDFLDSRGPFDPPILWLCLQIPPNDHDILLKQLQQFVTMRKIHWLARHIELDHVLKSIEEEILDLPKDATTIDAFFELDQDGNVELCYDKVVVQDAGLPEAKR